MIPTRASLLAIAYLRCSDLKQDRSIEDQRAVIMERAAADGVRIVRWFVDDGISGTTVRDRPGLLELRQWVQEHDGEVQVLYAWAQSRIGRQTAETFQTFQILDDAGIDTRFLSEPEPGDRDTRDIVRALRATFDTQHSRKLSKEVPRGMKGAAREGRWTYGTAPIGYRIEHRPGVKGHAGWLVPDDGTAETIGMVFDLYEAGHGDKATAAMLTRRGVPPPTHRKTPRRRDAGTWRRKHVATIVTNPVYAGRIVYKGEVLCEKAHPAIIDPERWDRLQAARQARSRAVVATSPIRPIRASERGVYLPWLRCGHCGGPMQVQHGSKGRFHYACRLRAENRTACVGMNARTDLLDAVIGDGIARDIVTEGALLAASQRWTASFEGENMRAIVRQREAIEARIGAADAALKRAGALVASGALEQGDVTETLRLHRAARDAARDDLALAPRPVAVPALAPADLTAFRDRVLAAMVTATVSERRLAISSLVTSITMLDGTVRVRYRPPIQPGVAPQGGPAGSW